ncbi:MAG TPA: amidohydrolase family protein [Puia sp.]
MKIKNGTALILFGFFSHMGFSQSLTDSGSFIIHKFEQAIGKEKYQVYRNQGGFSYFIDFKYTDRGSPVHLTDTLIFTSNLDPVSFSIKGGTSRFTTVNDSVVFHGESVYMKVDQSSSDLKLKKNSFPVAGYSPATAQMLLIKFWNSRNYPVTIYTIPFGDVHITRDGQDTISFLGKPSIFIRYVIQGIVWGNELMWTDEMGQLICLITNDAEGDKQEIVYESAESLLPVFVEKAAVKGMQLFAKEVKGTVQIHNLVAIEGGTLVDVAGGKTISNTTVLIEDGMIRAVGISSSVMVPANAFVIDAKGKTILPGLWDMHAHFEQAEWGPAYLAAGVTTVRDVGNEFEYINSIQQTIDNGNGIGPHILKAGIIDGKGPFALGIIQADTKEEAIRAVQRYKNNGFVQIKIYSSVKPAIVKAICDEAHRLGMTVTGHIPNGMSLQQGVDSGMDMVNHIQYVASVMKINKITGTIDFTDSVNIALLKFIKDHHVVIDPTMGVFELIFRSVKDSINFIEPDFASLPEPLKPLFTNMGMSDENGIQRGIHVMKIFKQILNALYKDNILIVAGTDMNFPGYSLLRELELYVDAGLSPMAAIQSATIIPARVMRMESKTGSIEVGKRADIILVDENPLDNIRNIRKINTVIKGGQIYNPVKLHKMAGFNVAVSNE